MLLLQHVNLDNAKDKDVKQVLDTITENVDCNNRAQVSITLNAIKNEFQNQTITQEERDEYIKKIFKENFESLDNIRDGGSISIELKDGTSIYQDGASGTPDADKGKITFSNDDKEEMFTSGGILIPQEFLDMDFFE